MKDLGTKEQMEAGRVYVPVLWREGWVGRAAGFSVASHSLSQTKEQDQHVLPNHDQSLARSHPRESGCDVD